MLDEPTNHLDLDTIAWLEGWLRGYRGAVLVVSHDRAFLDAVSTQTLELGSRGLRVYPLRYSEYADRARERPRARARARRAPAGLRRQDRRLHPQEHRRTEDQAGAEPAQDARQARSRRPARGRVGGRRARQLPLRARGALRRHRPRREGPRRDARRTRALRGRRPPRPSRRAHRHRRAERRRQDRRSSSSSPARATPSSTPAASGAAPTCRRATSISTSAR